MRHPLPRAAAPWASVVAALLAASPLAAPLAAQGTRPAAVPTSAASSVADDLAMMEEAAAFTPLVERFLAAAAAGDAARVEALVSAGLARQAGRETVARVVREQFLPFFADFARRGPTTITRTTDQFGNRGFAYYGYAVARDGTRRPFVLYVVQENGAPVVANLLVDRFVEGRHPGQP